MELNSKMLIVPFLDKTAYDTLIFKYCATRLPWLCPGPGQEGAHLCDHSPGGLAVRNHCCFT